MLQGIFLRSYIYPYLTEFLYVVQERPECSNALEAARPECSNALEAARPECSNALEAARPERAEAPSPGQRPG